MIKYVLISPARNEEGFIRKTLDSMVAQTHLPERWVIVDDGSSDDTADIVSEYLLDYPWIELVRRPAHSKHNFAGKVHAFNAGLEAVDHLTYEVIGNLDADISFDPDYLQFLMTRFEDDPRLGVAGTPFIDNGYDSAHDSFEGENHVAGGCQLFRRECFEEIGGYVPNKAGGIDWVAVTTARMMGWTTRSFNEKRFNHFRPLGTAERGIYASIFSYGEKDYYLGNSPIWEVFRVGFRLIKSPLVTGGLTLMGGYLYAAIRRIDRAVSPELMRFHRREQMQKLRRIFKSVLTFRKVDRFSASEPNELSGRGKP
jgi:glycosyltransferase involved in cell wall biosynthesis